MQPRFIMTAFGKDRPGIVADVTKILFENGCNLQETTMTQLADEFTLILLFSGGSDQVLDRECRRLEKDKAISAFVRPLAERQERQPSRAPTMTLHVEGVDQAGIVYRISRFLADQHLNILDLQSSVSSAPSSGTLLYLMDIQIEAPSEGKWATVEGGLSEVADELNVDIAVRR